MVVMEGDRETTLSSSGHTMSDEDKAKICT